MAREWRPSTTEKRIWTIGVFVVRLFLSGIAGFVAFVLSLDTLGLAAGLVLPVEWPLVDQVLGRVPAQGVHQSQ